MINAPSKFRRLYHRARRGGVAAIILVISLTALLVSGAIIVDIGYANLVAAELQKGLDAAAMAGASRLSAGPAAARAAAVRVAALNKAGGAAIPLQSADVKIGTWSNGAFTILTGAAEANGNAVYIERTDSGVDTFLANVMGVDHLSVDRRAIAGVAGTDSAVCGVLVEKFADINGNLAVDSYNSTLGAYSSSNKASNGGICSNDSLKASGSTVINGSLRYGPDSGDYGTVSGNAYISGSVKAMSDHIVLPTVDPTWYRTHNDNAKIGKTSKNKNPVSGGSFSMNSTEKLTLSTGTYYFTGFTLDAQAALTISGNVTIYVEGDFHANGGGVVNTSKNPANFTVKVSGAKSLQVNGSADFYGSIIAPACEGHLNGNASFYGVIIADRMELNGNGKFHADESMVTKYVGSTPGNKRSVLYL